MLIRTIFLISCFLFGSLVATVAHSQYDTSACYDHARMNLEAKTLGNKIEAVTPEDLERIWSTIPKDSTARKPEEMFFISHPDNRVFVLVLGFIDGCLVGRGRLDFGSYLALGVGS